MIESDLSATKLGKILYGLASDLGNEAKIAATLSDTFVSKAPATLYKRTSSLWAYFVKHSSGDYRGTLHLTEAQVYEYVSALRDEAGATSAQHFTEALNFFNALVGFLKFDVAEVLSPRVRGVVHSSFAKKRPRVQARPLTATEVRGLERLVTKSSDEFVIMAAGFCLFCLANAARWSDAQAAESLKLDTSGRRPVVEAATLRHKTASSAERKSTLLPYVGFGRILSTNGWAKPWLEVVERVRGKLKCNGFVLPAFSEKTGKWLPRKMSSGEGTLVLRDLLAIAKASDEAASLPSTHSLKATILSWACKHGSLSLQERMIIGHHLDKPSVSALTYGRANFVEPLRKLNVVLSDIEKKTFFPDARPSALITAELKALDERTEEFERMMRGDDDAADDPNSASEVDDAEDAEEQAEEVVPKPERRREVLRDKEKFLCHVMSGCLHVKADDFKFLCGRPRSANYVEPSAESVHGSPVCDQCAAAEGARKT